MFDDTARHFEINWSLDGNGSDAVGGMGWSTGDAKAVISYNAGYWNASGKASLQLYGWTCNGTTPQEYYVVENWGSEKYVPWDPANGRLAKSLGTVKSDGGTYDIFKTKQINAGHGCGTGGKDFFQYWSVRTDRRPSGNQSITFANHAAAWAASKRGFYTKGVSKGYQVMGAEGLNTSSGTLNMTTWK
jgi:endo-1,4-beta-xylanase